LLPRFLDYKTELTSGHVASFVAIGQRRSREENKKKETKRKKRQQQNIRPPGSNVPGGLITS